MKIGIDIDDVVVQYVKDFSKFYNSKKGTSLTYGDFFTSDFSKVANASRNEVIEIISLFRKTDLFANLDFVPGAREGILLLWEKNEIVFITSRHQETKKITINFIEKTFSEKETQVFFSGELWGKGKSKGEICLDLGVEIMIEDRKDYALDCASKGIKVFLLETPWNLDCVEHKNITKVKNWDELIKKINKFLKK